MSKDKKTTQPILMREYALNLTQSRMNGVTKRKRLATSVIKRLFARFSAIWGLEWDRRLEGHGDATAREWAEALAEFKESQLETAIELARVKCEWPPRIAEFIELCKNANDGMLIKFHEALDLANRKLQNRITVRQYDDLELERELIAILAQKIYRSQNDKADIMICVAQSCNNHILVDIGSDQPWYCDAHRSH